MKKNPDIANLSTYILDNLFAYVALLDIDGRIIEVNKAPVVRAGFNREDVIGKFFFDAPWWSYDAKVQQQLKDAIAAANLGGLIRYEVNVKMGNDLVPIDFQISPLCDDSGKIVGLLPTAVDISARKLAEEKLRLNKRIFETIQEAIMITDADCHIVDVNEAFTKITGYSRDEILGKKPQLLQSGQHDTAFYKAMWKNITEQGHWSGEIWNRRKNGEVYAELITISEIRDDQGNLTHYVSGSSDISLIKERENQLEHIAFHDPLTQLPNRQLLADRLQQALARAERSKGMVAIACLDLDGFKAVNDTYGHSIGDALLIEVAKRLLNCVRNEDTVARLGGDEFVILLCDLNSKERCEIVLQRILQVLIFPYHLSEKTITKISGSIGYTLFPDDNTDTDTLVRHADHAMYTAKQAGKNRIQCFDIREDKLLQANIQAIAILQEALQKREFCLYIQPKINLATGQVVSAEALIRWLHPIRGIVSPNEFLPLIEEHEVSVAIGEWVMQEALSLMHNWAQKGCILPLSINIGARHLRQDNFFKYLVNLLEQFPAVSPNHLEIEIIETAALDDIHKVSKLIGKCHSLGVNFSLDDFGTGYCSLSYLKQLSVTTLKIDQTFVRNLLFDTNDQTLVRGVIGLAQAFNMRTVAEGVETWEQANCLLKLGCEMAQGYIIARPMPVAEVLNWVNHFQMPDLKGKNE